MLNFAIALCFVGLIVVPSLLVRLSGSNETDAEAN